MHDASPKSLSSRSLTVILAIATAALIVATAPATIVGAALNKEGVAVAAASGSVWRGELKGVSVQGVKIGDVAYAADPVAILTGRFAARAAIRNGAVNGAGRIAASLGGRVVVTNAKFTFALDAARRYAILGAPLAGTLRVDASKITFSGEGCLEGSAKLWTDALMGPAKRVGSKAFDLAGDGACKGRNFVVALAGRGGDGAVSVNLSVSPALTYVVNVEAEPARTEVAEALQILGFENANGVLTMAATGALRGVGS
jgi:hypothetical protein